MRLKKLKLAGFKSFVDPTALEFKSELVGVVGPNGCGKSNVIDAVRWVMGESSAKNLRGGSMTDVIFNGSSTRKPVSLASVELIFDNSEGKLGGEYAAYEEISIKREVDRDAQSNYYLNGTRCRRRDITDIFLGTGLGPRSYSIIEQGMISRVIEAKPEDLRAFLEEAAGISVYKKRRHDTELRIRHTQENLERIKDLIQEQERLLERLKRQSSAAMRYKEYKSERDIVDLQLSALKWRDFDTDLQQYSEQIRGLSTKLEERLARRASIDNELVKIKEEHNDKSDRLHEVQEQYYEIGSEIARREQTIQHHHERQQQLQEDLAIAEQALEDLLSQIEEDNTRLKELDKDLAIIDPDYNQIKAIAEDCEIILDEAKAKLSVWNSEWDELQQEAQSYHQRAEVERTKIEQIEKQIREIEVNIDRLQQEKNTLHDTEFETLIASLTEEIDARECLNREKSSEYELIQNNINEFRVKHKKYTDEIDEVRGTIQSLKGRKSSLEALQQAAIGNDNETVNSWLTKKGFDNLPRLAQLLNVESGFEKAVETVLGDYLEAVCLDDLAGLLTSANDLVELQSSKLLFLSKSKLIDDVIQSKNNNAMELLASKIKTDLPIENIVKNIYVVDGIEQVLSQHNSIEEHESIITKDGIWFGKNWIRVQNKSDSRSGVLAREKELTDIEENLIEKYTLLETLEVEQFNAANQITSLESNLDELRQQQQIISTELRELTAKLSTHETKLENTIQRNNRIANEINDYKLKLEENSEEVNLSRIKLEEAIEQMATTSSRKEQLQIEKESIILNLKDAEANFKSHNAKLHELELKRQTILTQIQAIKGGLARLDKNLQATRARQSDIEASLRKSLPEDELQEELETLLAERLTIDSKLSIAREELEESSQKIEALEKERKEIENTAQGLRDNLDKIKLEWQSLEVRKDTIEEKFQKENIKAEEIIKDLPDNANESEWQTRLLDLEEKIEKLGPINLAAIEEYKSESERSEYLQSQHDDLTEALETLENAIKKIDKETRSKFKETFDEVNTNFKALFPKLFGGGEAYLELIGEDLLDTGVSVMARPPGKRNSSIKLLSGGEKALTAVSLVFSIFQLNPAPFCMLDEVDAPLDDANVGRFCKMIKEMSQKVQFIFITHNKITMEISKQLAGVTMKEPGVSRLVAVDIDEAVQLVDA